MKLHKNEVNNLINFFNKHQDVDWFEIKNGNGGGIGVVTEISIKISDTEYLTCDITDYENW